jgi:dTDP-4-dehydrorhamnose reductase
MKILVTGAAGMLGSALCPMLKERGYAVYATDIVTSDEAVQLLDVRRLEMVRSMVDEVKPDMVMHLAAETDVDGCELHADQAYLTNTIGTQNVALICQKHDVEMVYISTLGVFDGNKPAPYTEFDSPNPVNVYGSSKLEGERIVDRLLRKYYIVRAGWMMGGGPRKDKKFVAKIIKLMDTNRSLRVVNDKIGSPTYTEDLSRSLAELIQTGYYGLYHCTNKGCTSRYDVARKIAECLHRSDVSIEPVTSAYFPLPAPRARSEASTNYMLGLLGMDKNRPWNEALKAYLQSEWKA